VIGALLVIPASPAARRNQSQHAAPNATASLPGRPWASTTGSELVGRPRRSHAPSRPSRSGGVQPSGRRTLPVGFSLRVGHRFQAAYSGRPPDCPGNRRGAGGTPSTGRPRRRGRTTGQQPAQRARLQLASNLRQRARLQRPQLPPPPSPSPSTVRKPSPSISGPCGVGDLVGAPRSLAVDAPGRGDRLHRPAHDDGALPQSRRRSNAPVHVQGHRTAGAMLHVTTVGLGAATRLPTVKIDAIARLRSGLNCNPLVRAAPGRWKAPPGRDAGRAAVVFTTRQ